MKVKKCEMKFNRGDALEIESKGELSLISNRTPFPLRVVVSQGRHATYLDIYAVGSNNDQGELMTAQEWLEKWARENGWIKPSLISK